MCDYSLHAVSTRPAKLGDRLITSQFMYTTTRGFGAIGEPGVAVCMKPGTELIFEAAVQAEIGLVQTIISVFRGIIRHKVGRFRQINLQNENTHHDAIEFPDGKVVLLTQLRPGQRATVLQLPADAHRLAQRQPHELRPQSRLKHTPEREMEIETGGMPPSPISSYLDHRDESGAKIAFPLLHTYSD